MTATFGVSSCSRMFLGVAAIGFAISASYASDIVARASVIDGDTIEIRGQSIRLWGIDAPESSQLCRGPDSLHYRCGAVAANGLSNFIASRPVTCSPRDIDRYGRTVAACTVAGVDLDAWLVASGLAIDFARYSRGTYSTDQAKAQTARAGIWAGSFTEPAKYRQCVRTGGAVSLCSDQEAFDSSAPLARPRDQDGLIVERQKIK